MNNNGLDFSQTTVNDPSMGTSSHHGLNDYETALIECMKALIVLHTAIPHYPLETCQCPQATAFRQGQATLARHGLEFEKVRDYANSTTV